MHSSLQVMGYLMNAFVSVALMSLAACSEADELAEPGEDILAVGQRRYDHEPIGSEIERSADVE